MDAQRLAYLDELEADLTTTTTAARRPRRPLTRRIGVHGAMVAVGLSLVAVSPAAAHAGPAPASTAAVPYCGVPNPVPYTHSKACNVIVYYTHEFLSSSPAGPGGQRTCYNFWSTRVDLGCGADPGRFTKVCA